MSYYENDAARRLVSGPPSGGDGKTGFLDRALAALAGASKSTWSRVKAMAVAVALLVTSSSGAIAALAARAVGVATARLQEALDAARSKDRSFAEAGFGIVEAILILLFVIAMVFLAFKFIVPAVTGAANHSANCITNANTAACSAP